MIPRTGRAKSYFGAVVSAVLSSRPAGRELEVFPGDTFLVSYLRSGSTWMRFLLANLLHPDQQVSFVNLKYSIPSIYDFPNHKLRSLPRVLKSHEWFDPRYPRVIHLVRDPRDVAVSCYFYHLKTRVLPDGSPLDTFVDQFLKARVVDYADRLGSWREHSLSWSFMRSNTTGYLLVRYEDLLAQPVVELQRIAAHLGCELSPEVIERAIDASTGQKLRSLEQQQWKMWEPTKNSRADIPFIREARCGTWRQHLSASSTLKIEQSWGDAMSTFGYEASNAPLQMSEINGRV